MKKTRNKKNNKNVENMENMKNNENIENISDTEMASEDTLKEWDMTDDDEVHEFLSRDLDVVTRTRQRLREKQEAKEQAVLKKKSKSRKVRENSKKLDKERSKKADDNNTNFVSTVTSCVGNFWKKWLEIYHKFTMQILYGALGILAMILLVAIVLTNVGDKKTDDVLAPETSSQEKDTSETESSTDKEEDKGPVVESAESDIHKIVASYFDALYVKATIDEVKKYIDDVTNFNESRLKTYDKYYETVDNIKCYKFDTSRVQNSYVVFVTYDLKLYNIDTAIPSGEALVVKKGADGKYLIHNLTDKEVLDLKVSNEDYVASINELEKQVLDAFNAALAADSELKEVYDMMTGLANKATEQSGTTDNKESETETTT